MMCKVILVRLSPHFSLKEMVVSTPLVSLNV